MKHFTITADTVADFEKLTEIDGNLSVCADFTAPRLIRIRGNLYVEAAFIAPALVEVTGKRLTKGPLKAIAPKFLYLSDAAKFAKDNFQTIFDHATAKTGDAYAHFAKLTGLTPGQVVVAIFNENKTVLTALARYVIDEVSG